MTKRTRCFLLALCILTFSGLMPVQAQETAYLPITPDNIHQVVAISQVECTGESWRLVSAAFSSSIFLPGCSHGKEGFSIYALPDTTPLWSSRAVPHSHRLYVLEQGDLIVAENQGKPVAVRRGADQYEFDADESAVLHAPVTVSPDRKYLAYVEGEIGGSDNQVVIYNLPDFEPVISFPAGGDSQRAVLAFSTQGSIAIGQSDGIIRIFNLETGDMEHEFPPTPLTPGFDTEGYHDLIFTPDGSGLLVSECIVISMGCYEEGITHLNTVSGEVLAETTTPYCRYSFLGFTGEESFVFAQSNAGIALLNTETLEETPLPFPSGHLCGENASAAVNEAGALLAVYDADRSAYVVYGIPANE